MDEELAPTLPVLAERVEQLRAEAAGLRVEVHDLRTEVRTMLRTDYLTGPEMTNKFITRDELAAHSRERRELWPVLFAGVCSLASIASILNVFLGGH